MPAPAFTRDDTAILLIDHQIGTLQLVKNIPQETAIRSAVALARTAAILGIPTVLTSSQEDALQGPLIPELAEILPHAFAERVRRPGVVDAWAYAPFKNAVERTGRRNLVMAGVTTDVCLVFPAVNAVADGYAVQAVLDASGSHFELSEEAARRRMADAGVVLTATNTLIAELAQDWSTSEGQELIGLLFTSILPPIKR